MKVIEVLQQSVIENGIVKLPNVQLDKNTYREVAKALEGIGGKWKGGKVAGFVFSHDPTDLLAEIAGGAKRNLKKEFQFFETPAELADELVGRADLYSESLTVLEPSAGHGSLVKAVHRKQPSIVVDYFELMPQNRQILAQLTGANLLGEDFLKASSSLLRYDRIIANPPFTKNQDVDHIQHMFSVLAPGGILVAVASTHWKTQSGQKEKGFAQFLSSVGADVEILDKGTFKDSGTMVESCLITIHKEF